MFLASNQNFDLLDPEVLKQLLWLNDKLTENHSRVDWAPDIYIWLMRQILGGSTSESNIWLTTAILESIYRNLSFTRQNQRLVQYIVYNFTRLIQDHKNHLKLRQHEIDIVMDLISEDITLVVTLGKDYLRLLQQVCHIEEFETLWTRICHKPESFGNSNFHG